MVYVMISPNYAVSTCPHAGMRYNKKRKSFGNRRKKFFHRHRTAEIWNLHPQKFINFRCFSEYYHRKKILYKGKTGISHA
ncbi:predicted protein [Methanosarcina acetivorans C2A]|uniref:Uncharacterized protein n=1 Tax=Methanosarcina acetivorans (strain ATCC 35395 / DSM 2834 / JCM 12185 / C2A) TaxID=188937 RepID=Q8TTH8_METAC|nr:predicted protein [Methanosarcina acetivorans C2A]